MDLTLRRAAARDSCPYCLSPGVLYEPRRNLVDGDSEFKREIDRPAHSAVGVCVAAQPFLQSMTDMESVSSLGHRKLHGIIIRPLGQLPYQLYHRGRAYPAGWNLNECNPTGSIAEITHVITIMFYG